MLITGSTVPRYAVQVPYVPTLGTGRHYIHRYMIVCVCNDVERPYFHVSANQTLGFCSLIKMYSPLDFRERLVGQMDF